MTQIGLRPFRAIWPCRDGYVLWFYQGGQIGAPANRALSEWMDEEGLDNPLSQVTNWEEHDMANVSKETHDAFQAAIYNFFMRHTRKEIAEEGLKRGINAVVECVPSDVLENPQLDARKLWTKLDHPGLSSTLAYPRHFFLCSETENYIKHPAPGIGQDNDDIYVKELGISGAELAALKDASVI
jgi:crotonobetainyl-CoA:carnitine CoA-transferase CaiB-like acyl-CoA transferase